MLQSVGTPFFNPSSGFVHFGKLGLYNGNLVTPGQFSSVGVPRSLK